MFSGEGWEEKDAILGFVYHLFKTHKRPLHYSVLMDEVWSQFPLPEGKNLVQAKAMFYTWLNFDARFVYLGLGQWGLRTWEGQKESRRVPFLTLMHKVVAYDNWMSSWGSGRECLQENTFSKDLVLVREEELESNRADFELEED